MRKVWGRDVLGAVQGARPRQVLELTKGRVVTRGALVAGAKPCALNLELQVSCSCTFEQGAAQAILDDINELAHGVCLACSV